MQGWFKSYSELEVLMSPPSSYRGKVELISDRKQMNSTINDVICNAKKSLNICGDSTLPSFSLSERLMKAYQEAKSKGVKIRYITEITRDNLKYCKQILKFAEVRHLNNLVGNFVISDKEYLGQASGHNFLSYLIYSDEQKMVEQQNFMFKNLWNNATTHRDRISSLELGVEPEEVKVLSDPVEIRRTYANLINSANFEISLIIATKNALQRNYRGGIITLLAEAAKKRNVNVNLIIPTYENDTTRAKFPHIESGMNPRFRVKSIVPAIPQTHMIKTTFLIADRRLLFIIDIKDDNKENFIDAVGFATYHNSKSRTESYSFIFDTLWRQADLHESLKEANRNLIYAYEKLQEHDQMEKEFINLAAHELRTPSQSIIGYSELLKALPERNKQYEEAISRNAERLYSLVTNMLSIARIESQTLKLDKTSFDLNLKIVNVINDVKQQVDLHKIDKDRIEFTPLEKITIFADKEKIFEVLANLLNNALKFTQHGTIAISAERRGKTNEAIIKIKDSGPGIDPEIIPHLFSKFKTKSEKGLGLGLYIAKSIVEAHGGKIEAYNNVNSKGATFVVTLPLK